MNRVIYLSLLLLVSGLLQPAKGQVKEPIFLQLLDANGKLVIGTTDKLQLRSTIRLEEVTVVRTQETIGGTEVTLKADRIGTTQYEWNRKTGVVTIAGKTGYDYKAGTSWNSF